MPVPRSLLITALAWLAIAVSALLLPISVISQIMIMVGSYGTEHVEFLGWLTVVALPPTTLVAAVGLLRRRRWGWIGMMAVAAGIGLANLAEVLHGPRPAEIHTGPDGTVTTVMATGTGMAGPFAVAALVVIVLLLWRRGEFPAPARPTRPAAPPPVPAPVAVADGATEATAAEDARGWRVGHRGRDQMFYEERWAGGWRRIEIDGEMLTGRAHHAIYFASPAEWATYPDWARDRRAEIIARVTSEFRPPDYEYGAAGGVPTPWPAVQQAVSMWRVLVLLGVLVMGAAALWYAAHGVSTGETLLAARYGHRTVTRAQDPGLFWVSILVYAAVGVGTLGLAAWDAWTVLRGRIRR